MIHSIWQVDYSPSFHMEQIMPKGVVEIIFNFSDSGSIPAQLGNKQFDLSKCFINGFNTAPVQIQLPKQQVFFGVVFQPLAIKKIFGTPASEFSDLTVDVSLLDSSFHSLWHQLAEENDFDNRLSVFLGWVKRNLLDWQPQEKLINDFLYSRNQHDLSVDAIGQLILLFTATVIKKTF